MRLKAAAKVNLSLDVTGKLENGYHLIESFFQTVGLYDVIDIELNDSREISLTCSDKTIPCNESNIAYKAALIFREKSGIDFGCKIHIEKNIPSQAGMDYSFNELVKIGTRLGADVPFFLMGGTAFAEGIGEKLTKAPDYSGRILVIGKGSQGISTVEAYRKIDSLINTVHPQTDKLAESLKNGGSDAYRYFGNLFELAAELEDVEKIKSYMLGSGALNALMTGSGSAVFGVFDNISDAEKCCSDLKKKGFFSSVCRTVEKSFEEIM